MNNLNNRRSFTFHQRCVKLVLLMRNILFTLLTCCAALFAADEYAARGNTWAQKLVDDTIAKHKEIVVMALHVASPTDPNYPIIASNIGRIGKKADEDDMRVVNTGKPNLEVNATGDRFEVELALRESKGKLIGAAGIVFNYKAGDNKQALRKKAEAIAKEMQAQITTKAKLFETLR